MTKSNTTSTATFATRGEALVYRDSVTLLATMHPERGLRTCGPWQASWEPGSPYAWAVAVAWDGQPF
jgi:hypothetical protein